MTDLSPEEQRRNRERLYLVTGYEDTTDSKLCYESELFATVLSIIFFEPKDCPDDEREYWDKLLQDPEEWRVEHGVKVSFQKEVGEIGHLEIQLVTDTSLIEEQALSHAREKQELLERLDETGKDQNRWYKEAMSSWGTVQELTQYRDSLQSERDELKRRVESLEAALKVAAERLTDIRDNDGWVSGTKAGVALADISRLTGAPKEG